MLKGLESVARLDAMTMLKCLDHRDTISVYTVVDRPMCWTTIAKASQGCSAILNTITSKHSELEDITLTEGNAVSTYLPLLSFKIWCGNEPTPLS